MVAALTAREATVNDAPTTRSSTGDTVVLVNPLATGAGLKSACTERGSRVAGVYTLPQARLAVLDPDYTYGDAVSVHRPASTRLSRCCRTGSAP
jgi:hypothetical protein